MGFRSDSHAVEVILKERSWTEVCGTMQGQRSRGLHSMRWDDSVHEHGSCMPHISNAVVSFSWFTDYRLLLLCVFIAILASQVQAVSTHHRHYTHTFTQFHFNCCLLVKKQQNQKVYICSVLLVLQSPLTHGRSGSVCWMFPPVGGSKPHWLDQENCRLFSVKWGWVLSAKIFHKYNKQQ